MSTIQIGIIVFALGILAMFVWFSYLFATDPSNIFGRRPRTPAPAPDAGKTDDSSTGKPN